MREALNENPVVQVAIFGALVVVVGLVFMLNTGGGGGADTASDGTASAPPPSPPPAGGSAEPAEGAPAAGSPAAPAPVEVPLGPPPPQPVLDAYARGETVVLLVVRSGSVEDEMVARSVKALEREPGVATFVVPTELIAAYARITRGAGVTRTPALVVLRPRYLTEGAPQALVHYGYRGPRSVVQAVRDAAFHGEPASYAPTP